MQQCRQERHVKTRNMTLSLQLLFCVCVWHGKQRWGIIPGPTYWMSLSHTHHHLFPGCPIIRPKRARTEERQEGRQPQHKQKGWRQWKEGTVGPQICLCLDTEQPAGGTKYNMITLRLVVISEGKLGQRILPCGDISHQNELQWPGFSPADWSTSEPQCLWLYPTERQRGNEDDRKRLGEEAGKASTKPLPWKYICEFPVKVFKSGMWPTLTLCVYVHVCLWAYLRSESLPSSSPSLFL